MSGLVSSPFQLLEFGFCKQKKIGIVNNTLIFAKTIVANYKYRLLWV